jgi:haloacetate dehalogenase
VSSGGGSSPPRNPFLIIDSGLPAMSQGGWSLRAHRMTNTHDESLHFDGFSAQEIQTAATTIFVRASGHGPPILLLHGFPQTHLMWRSVAPVLARGLTVVCADLRGYGRSGCPPAAPDHAPYSKRAMAQDMVTVMERLGFRRFSVVGHDRGGRVAYRIALDHPDRVERLCVLDVVPTLSAWELADARFALGFWPWSLLAQPEPLPERILVAAADVIVEHALGAWGTPAAVFSAQVRAAYADALRDPIHAHAICEEYRAAATIDCEHDKTDRVSGRRITCPLLVLWSAIGPIEAWYRARGGPLALWRAWSDAPEGYALNAGHFLAEETPERITDALFHFCGVLKRAR